MKTLRKQLINWLFKHSKTIYTALFKNREPWYVTKNDLQLYHKESFGKYLGAFLDTNNSELIPKVERHDCYHVLCNYGTKTGDKIALQCLCYGNGKHCLYLLGAVVLGIAILPDYISYYFTSYKIGKASNVFHNFDYKKRLHVNIHKFRKMIFLKSVLSFDSDT